MENFNYREYLSLPWPCRGREREKEINVNILSIVGEDIDITDMAIFRHIHRVKFDVARSLATSMGLTNEVFEQIRSI